MFQFLFIPLGVTPVRDYVHHVRCDHTALSYLVIYQLSLGYYPVRACAAGGGVFGLSMSLFVPGRGRVVSCVGYPGRTWAQGVELSVGLFVTRAHLRARVE